MADDLNATATSDGGGNEEATGPVPRWRTLLGCLIAWDQMMTSHLAVCSSSTASWGSARPLMKLLELSGDPYPWIGGVSIAIAMARSAELRLTLFNLLFCTLTKQMFLIVFDGLIDFCKILLI